LVDGTESYHYALDLFPKVVKQWYIGDVAKSITVMLHTNSVHCVPNIIEIGQYL